ncbi:hypothetical protein [Burkholderia sp. SIMBA_062]
MDRRTATAILRALEVGKKCAAAKPARGTFIAGIVSPSPHDNIEKY